MSEAAIKKIQALQKETPSLSEKIGDNLHALIGEPVEFFIVMLTEREDKKILISTAGQIGEQNAPNVLKYFLTALAEQDEGFARVRAYEDSKGKH